MSSDLATRPTAPAATPVDTDNRYNAVQTKLTALAKALDAATVRLEQLNRSMCTNADRAQHLAQAIDEADLDPRFVEMTGAVAEALGAAGVQEVRMIDAALRRIAAGTYGACVNCGEPISEERLNVLPATPICRDCAAQR